MGQFRRTDEPMVAGSEAGAHPHGLKKVWTLIIRGGHVMRLQLHGKVGPGHEHNGRMSVWKMTGTAEEVEAAKALFTGPLVQAQVTVLTEGDDDAVEALRHRGES